MRVLIVLLMDSICSMNTGLLRYVSKFERSLTVGSYHPTLRFYESKFQILHVEVRKYSNYLSLFDLFYLALHPSGSSYYICIYLKGGEERKK